MFVREILLRLLYKMPVEKSSIISTELEALQKDADVLQEEISALLIRVDTRSRAFKSNEVLLNDATTQCVFEEVPHDMRDNVSEPGSMEEAGLRQRVSGDVPSLAMEADRLLHVITRLRMERSTPTRVSKA